MKKVLIIVTVLLLGGIAYWLINKGGETKTTEEAVEETAETINIENEGYIDILAKDALELFADENVVILDVSPKWDKGHLPGSINYYIGDGSLDKAISTLDKEKTYLVYCHVDSAAILGAQKLIDAGFTKVYRLLGNYSGWEKAGYPIEVEILGVEGFEGTALATVSYLNETFTHTVKGKFRDPTEGKFFEGWLVKNGGLIGFFSTGKLEKKDEMYELTYIANEDQRDSNGVVITEETESLGLDGNPEKHILEGTF